MQNGSNEIWLAARSNVINTDPRELIWCVVPIQTRPCIIFASFQEETISSADWNALRLERGRLQLLYRGRLACSYYAGTGCSGYEELVLSKLSLKDGSEALGNKLKLQHTKHSIFYGNTAAFVPPCLALLRSMIRLVWFFVNSLLYKQHTLPVSFLYILSLFYQINFILEFMNYWIRAFITEESFEVHVHAAPWGCRTCEITME